MNGYEKYRYRKNYEHDYDIVGKVDETEVYGTVYDEEAPNAGKTHTLHVVEDARTRLAADAPSSRRKKRKKRSHKGIYAVCIVVMCFCLTVLCADFFGVGNLFEKSSYAAKTKSYTPYYLVYHSMNGDITESYKDATAVLGEGGAGYVLKRGDCYYVTLACYQSRADAEKVAKKQANYGVIELKCRDFNAEAFPSDIALIAEKHCNVWQTAYTALYSAANEYASCRDKPAIIAKLQAERQNVQTAIDAFSAAVQNRENAACIEFKVMLAAIKSGFDNLIQSTSQEFLGELRYYSVMCVHCYCGFSENYF